MSASRHSLCLSMARRSAEWREWARPSADWFGRECGPNVKIYELKRLVHSILLEHAINDTVIPRFEGDRRLKNTWLDALIDLSPGFIALEARCKLEEASLLHVDENTIYDKESKTIYRFAEGTGDVVGVVGVWVVLAELNEESLALALLPTLRNHKKVIAELKQEFVYWGLYGPISDEEKEETDKKEKDKDNGTEIAEHILLEVGSWETSSCESSMSVDTNDPLKRKKFEIIEIIE